MIFLVTTRLPETRFIHSFSIELRYIHEYNKSYKLPWRISNENVELKMKVLIRIKFGWGRSLKFLIDRPVPSSSRLLKHNIFCHKQAKKSFEALSIKKRYRDGKRTRFINLKWAITFDRNHRVARTKFILDL